MVSQNCERLSKRWAKTQSEDERQDSESDSARTQVLIFRQEIYNPYDSYAKDTNKKI